MSTLHYSIIIPHKNRIALLETLVKSIPSRPDIEVIITDDASEDPAKTEALVHNYSTRYGQLQLITNTGNRSLGAGWARNQGIAVAKGEYVLFADSDDSFTPDAFNQFDQIRTNHPTVDLCLFRSQSIGMDGSPSTRTDFTNFLIEYAFSLDDHAKHSKLLRQIASKIDPPWAKLIKRTLLDNPSCRFEEIIVSDDILFNLSVVQHAQQMHIRSETVYCVLDHAETLGNLRTKESLDTRFNTSLRNIHALSESSFAPAKPISVCGGHVWRARYFGLKVFFAYLRRAIRQRAPLFYPWYRYVMGLYYTVMGYDPLKIRAFIILGKSIKTYSIKRLAVTKIQPNV
jgi:glycosyltransferase involved in cell wall biosynthesis